MLIHNHKIEVQKDHLQTLSRSAPIPAIAELIWNALDADATQVRITTSRDAVGLVTIVVDDNGHGITYKESEDLFTKLGGSWKAGDQISKGKGRMLHGKEGKGRFKALALGRVAAWKSRYKAADGIREFSIEMLDDQLDTVRISDEVPSSSNQTGVTLTISEPHKEWRVFDDGSAVEELEQLLAIYLADYPGISIAINGNNLDPSSQIKETHDLDLAAVRTEEGTHDVKLRVIEWKRSRNRSLYLCDESGFPFRRVDTRFHTSGFHFSAYIRSSYVSTFIEQHRLELIEMDSEIVRIREKAIDAIKALAHEAQSERAKVIVDEWKRDNVYPFPDKTTDPIEEAERQVFDIVAVSLHDHIPEFEKTPQKSKAFQLRMLRQAIERNPDELQLIISEVLQLPARQQLELAALLKETSLTAMISATRIISDRLKFLTGLEALIFDPEHKSSTKERSELHRLLASNSWVFGEQFNLTVDDRSLTEVLRKHLALQGVTTPVNEPVKRLDGRTGIVDLMLSRALNTTGRPKQRDHLVVELKAPKVKIGQKEVAQIQSYAFAVTKDERFKSLDTAWTFMVISNDLDDYADLLAQQDNTPEGCIYQSGKISIYVKRWSELIEENKMRLRFYKDRLELNISTDDGLKHLKERYSSILNRDDEELEMETADEQTGITPA